MTFYEWCGTSVIALFTSVIASYFVVLLQNRNIINFSTAKLRNMLYEIDENIIKYPYPDYFIRDLEDIQYTYWSKMSRLDYFVCKKVKGRYTEEERPHLQNILYTGYYTVGEKVFCKRIDKTGMFDCVILLKNILKKKEPLSTEDRKNIHLYRQIIEYKRPKSFRL
jgi:hypothetical protein